MNIFDKLSVSSITEKLNTKVIGKNIYLFSEVFSTNDFAKDLVKKKENVGAVVLAESQMRGRGRKQRKWISAQGKNILMSIVLNEKVNEFSPSLFMIKAALGVLSGLKSFISRDILIKWPNDLMINHKKVCGILVEGSLNSTSADIILGVGININMTENELGELTDTATSLLLEEGKIFNRSEIVAEVLNAIEQELATKNISDSIERWKTLSYTLGKPIEVKVNNKILKGRAVDINKDGFLLLEDENRNITKIVSGDITLCG